VTPRCAPAGPWIVVRLADLAPGTRFRVPLATDTVWTYDGLSCALYCAHEEGVAGSVGTWADGRMTVEVAHDE
jgi:hypothetical protein